MSWEVVMMGPMVPRVVQDDHFVRQTVVSIWTTRKSDSYFEDIERLFSDRGILSNFLAPPLRNCIDGERQYLIEFRSGRLSSARFGLVNF